jgi:adenosylcobyric acid synthase
MNPVLLKPQGDRTSQLIVRGQVRGTLAASRWREGREGLLDDILASYRRLRADSDIVVVEGAGSPAEINLRSGDIANMGFARTAGVPVLLVGDIDRGGVIAAIAGTRAVIDPADAAMIRGFVVNKFRGDPALFEDGYRRIEAVSGWRGYGVVPWLGDAARLPSEDAVVLERRHAAGDGGLVIACPILPRIANFDDLDPLKLDAGVDLRMVRPGEPIPVADWIVLAGSKATVADLAALREQGWDIDIHAHARRGGRVMGLCGGYQMLGRTVADPLGIEGPAGVAEGLGLLAVDTVLTGEKRLERVAGTARGARFAGYEMHMGTTDGPDTARAPVLLDDGRRDGAASADGRIVGSYIHGLFALAGQRAAWLTDVGVTGGGLDHAVSVDRALDAIAATLEQHLDIDAILALSAGADRG